MLIQQKHGRKLKLLLPPHYLIGIGLYHPFYSVHDLYKTFSLNCFLVNYLGVGDCKTNLDHGTGSNIKKNQAQMLEVLGPWN